MKKIVVKPDKIILTMFIVVMVFAFSTKALAQQTIKTYDKAIVLGDKYFKQNKLLDAKAYYQMALKYKKSDKYATTKINEIVKKLKTEMINHEKYYDIIDRADDFFLRKAFDAALIQYKNALKIIPDDKYAKNKIATINKIKLTEKNKQANFKRSINDAEKLLLQKKYQKALKLFESAAKIYPDNEQVTAKIKSTKTLITQQQKDAKKADEAILMAKRYLLIKNYAEALKYYKTADSLTPDNDAIILKINKLKPKAKIQELYNKKTGEADNLYIAKNYMAARKKYKEAAKLWPGNSYPTEMITKIDAQLDEQKKHINKNYLLAVSLADSLYNLQEFDNAQAEYNLALTLKPNESYPKKKLHDIYNYFAKQKKLLEENYNSIIASADSLLKKQQYNTAAQKYNLALKIKPDDEYPKKQLEIIKVAQDKLSAQEKIDKKYQTIVIDADRLMDSGEYNLAKIKYKTAQTVKPSEKYPKNKIKKIDEILANLKKQNELDNKYNNQIIFANRLIKERKYENAKKAFKIALTLKPEASLPKQKIIEIDSLITIKAEKKRLNIAYNTSIRQADSLYKNKKYDSALKYYTKATILKPAEQYAMRQKLLVADTIAKIATAKKIQNAYNDAIDSANKLLKDEKYELAKVAYQNALEIKKNEHYPKLQIAKINTTLKHIEKERQQRYLLAMTNADNLFSQKNYSEALVQYKVAKSIKPDEPSPAKKIEMCNVFINEQIKKLKTQYNLATADADKFYAAKIYDRAIKAYQRANNIKPDESYPKMMIAKITKFIEDNAIVDVINKPISIAKHETKKFTFLPLPVKIRKNNYVLVKARNTGKKAFKILFNFGSNSGKNGGFVLQVPDDNKTHDFIIRVGNQYKWFSKDNNWISIYAEGGSLEISLLRISKSN